MSLIGTFVKRLLGGSVDVSESYAAIVKRAFDSIEATAAADMLGGEEKIEAVYHFALIEIETAENDVIHTKLWAALDRELERRSTVSASTQQALPADASANQSNGAAAHDGLGGGNGP
jgi:hypothetical protein